MLDNIGNPYPAYYRQMFDVVAEAEAAAQAAGEEFEALNKRVEELAAALVRRTTELEPALQCPAGREKDGLLGEYREGDDTAAEPAERDACGERAHMEERAYARERGRPAVELVDMSWRQVFCHERTASLPAGHVELYSSDCRGLPLQEKMNETVSVY